MQDPTSGAFTTAGMRIRISAGPPATNDLAGFAALTYTDIAEITDHGSLGPVYAPVSHKPVGDAVEYILKGGKSYGTLTLQLAENTDDAGQVIVAEALGVKKNYYFELELADNEDGNTNTIIYVPGKVMSAPYVFGTVDATVGRTIDIAIQGSLFIAPKT